MKIWVLTRKTGLLALAAIALGISAFFVGSGNAVVPTSGNFNDVPIRRVQQGKFEGETFVPERKTRREREDNTLPFRLQDPGVYMVELEAKA